MCVSDKIPERLATVERRQQDISNEASKQTMAVKVTMTCEENQACLEVQLAALNISKLALSTTSYESHIQYSAIVISHCFLPGPGSHDYGCSAV